MSERFGEILGGLSVERFRAEPGLRLPNLPWRTSHAYIPGSLYTLYVIG